MGKMIAHTFVFVAALAALLLSACQKQSYPIVERDEPIYGSERTMVIAATTELKELFNKGACGAVYAKSKVTMTGPPPMEWQDGCDELVEHVAQLGQWREIVAGPTSTCGNEGTVCLAGQAIFGKRQYEVESAWWVRKGDTPLLLYIGFGEHSKMTWGISQPYKPFLIDSPLPVTRPPGGLGRDSG